MPWLMKAEPDSRLEKGIDVKFSIDDLKAMGTSKWDGVRNHQAKNMMKSQMKIGDKVLFYHSNTKNPGVYGLAEIVREGYPDYTAWDPSHPYYHPASTATSPTWFMVDITYKSHLAHPVLLSLFKYLAGCEELPEEVAYIGQEGFKAIGEMVLVRAGRLSVQPVTPEAYEAVLLLGTRGGWESIISKTKASKGKGKGKAKVEGDDVVGGEDEAPEKPSRNGKDKKVKAKKDEEEEKDTKKGQPPSSANGPGSKRKPTPDDETKPEIISKGTRASKRLKAA